MNLDIILRGAEVFDIRVNRDAERVVGIREVDGGTWRRRPRHRRTPQARRRKGGCIGGRIRLHRQPQVCVFQPRLGQIESII